jgi:hypothetical protein
MGKPVGGEDHAIALPQVPGLHSETEEIHMQGTFRRITLPLPARLLICALKQAAEKFVHNNCLFLEYDSVESLFNKYEDFCATRKNSSQHSEMVSALVPFFLVLTPQTSSSELITRGSPSLYNVANPSLTSP